MPNFTKIEARVNEKVRGVFNKSAVLSLIERTPGGRGYVLIAPATYGFYIDQGAAGAPETFSVPEGLAEDAFTAAQLRTLRYLAYNGTVYEVRARKEPVDDTSRMWQFSAEATTEPWP